MSKGPLAWRTAVAAAALPGVTIAIGDDVDTADKTIGPEEYAAAGVWMYRRVSWGETASEGAELGALGCCEAPDGACGALMALLKANGSMKDEGGGRCAPVAPSEKRPVDRVGDTALEVASLR